MERKELIELLKGRVLRVQTHNEWMELCELLDEVGLEWIGSRGIDKEDIWKKYGKMLGVILNKDGRKYKVSYINYRLAQVAKGLEVVTLDK